MDFLTVRFERVEAKFRQVVDNFPAIGRKTMLLNGRRIGVIRRVREEPTP